MMETTCSLEMSLIFSRLNKIQNIELFITTPVTKLNPEIITMFPVIPLFYQLL
jgi:hypothetical protein